MTQEELIRACILRHVRACRRLGVPVENLERVEIEAADLVRAGEFTVADLEPTRHDAGQAAYQRYRQYDTPKDVSIH